MNIDRKYIVGGVAGLAFVLLIISVVLFFTTRSTGVAGGAVVTATATAAVAEALRRRRQTRRGLEDLLEEDFADKITEVHDRARDDMKSEADSVLHDSDADKITDGNNLFS